MSLLQVNQVVKRFGGVIAVDGFSLDIEAGQVVALIGPNGAGKSTLMNILSGLHRPRPGHHHLRRETDPKSQLT